MEQKNENSLRNYYWVRVFDYQKERDTYDKGTMLYETYYKDTEKDLIKKELQSKFNGIKFAKPRSKDGIYAIIMESSRFFYERFTVHVDTLCCECNKEIHSSLANTIRSEKKKSSLFRMSYTELENMSIEEQSLFFCSYECKALYSRRWYKGGDIPFQSREQGKNSYNTAIEGYVYEIHNYKTDEYYIGKTQHLPFFRWQEHVKSSLKGDIEDLTFRVISKVLVSNDSDKQLHDLEAWWINLYIAEGKKVMNKQVPRFTQSEWEDRYEKIVEEFKASINMKGSTSVE